VGEAAISFRLDGVSTKAAPLLRATVAYANDYYDKRERGKLGVSYSLGLASTAAFVDADLCHRYGMSWCHAVSGAVAGFILDPVGGQDILDSPEIVEKNVLAVIMGLFVADVLLAPWAIANADINVGWQTVKLSVGWNTDLFVWRQTLLIFQPRVALKLAMPRVVVEGGASWILATDAALHSGAVPCPFACIGVALDSH
jgi:hypothetical protein